MAVYLGISNNGQFISSDGYALHDSDSVYLTALPLTTKFKITLNGVAYRVNVKLPVKESE